MAERSEIRISGRAGEGVVLAGTVLGRAAAMEGKRVIQTQSYGAEARGTPARSEVIISDGQIAYPMIRRCDVLIALSQSALERYLAEMRDDGMLIVEENVTVNLKNRKLKVVEVPAKKISRKLLGSELYANVVMLGALVKLSGIVQSTTIIEAIKKTVSITLQDVNITAFRVGFDMDLRFSN